MNMFKKTLSLTLVLTLLLTSLVFVPGASAVQYVNSRTTLVGSSASKLNNIDLAVQAINGVYVPYGATFSFNETVGPRNSANGYRPAMNGRGAEVTGGGVAQVAATLYLALMDVPGRIQFGEIYTYGSQFVDNYVDNGDLAVITDYNAGTDLSFTNLADDMTIEMWENGSFLYCSITVGKAASTDNWFDSWWTTPAPKRTLVASASIYCGKETNLLHNVRLASACVDDITLSTGDTFSFNTVVGPRSKDYGYKPATNGRGAEVTGGGVAQVASVIWLAVKNMSDIWVLEKSTYGERYNQNYVASSADAIVTDYGAGTDFSFRYTGYGSITIYTSLTNGTLTCEIYR
jgi:vancomycin resistance protein YoaR